MKQFFCLIVIAIAIFNLAGCNTSKVYFESPSGTTVTLVKESKQFTIPAVIDLKQKESIIDFHLDKGGRPIRMVLPDGTKLTGYIYVYKISTDEVEKLAEVTFQLTEDQIEKLENGSAVTVVGYTARKQSVYKINLGLDRK